MKVSLFKYLILSLLISASNALLASEEADTTKSNDFDVNEVLMHHIKDTYEWHILDYVNKNDEHVVVSIPFPIILIGNGQFDIFMSSEFHHGDKTVKRGNNEYILYHEKIYYKSENGNEHGIEYKLNDKGEKIVANAKPLDFSITKNVVGVVLIVIVMLLIFLSVARGYKKRPGRPAGLQAFMEPVILFVKNDIVVPVIGEQKSEKFLPYLLTVFFFILFGNLFGLMPIFLGGANVTGNISVTFTLALFTMLITNFSGNKEYWKHIFAVPGVPIWLYPIMIPVELLGIIIKPFALMVRLFANITAGHIIVLSLISVIFIFKSAVMASVSIPLGLFMNILELLVAFLQAYVFTMLSALFIGLAVQEEH